jgi:hypothetical protein
MVKIVCLDSQEEACSSPALICHCRSSMPSDIFAALALISLIVFNNWKITSIGAPSAESRSFFSVLVPSYFRNWHRLRATCHDPRS